MEKTYKEIRENLARKYNSKRNRLNYALDELQNLGYQQDGINAIREEVISNLQDDLENEELYYDSGVAHYNEYQAKLGLNILKKEKEELQKEYENKIAELKEEYENRLQRVDKEITIVTEHYKREQIAYRGKVEEETEVKDTKEELYGDKEKILENLKKKVVIEENVDYLGYKGKKVHITLPEVEGKFEGFKFEYFVSDDEVDKGDLEYYPKLEEKSYSMKEIGNLLSAINIYMKAMGVETDGDMNYEEDIKYENIYMKTKRRESFSDRNGCAAGGCLDYIIPNQDWFWLKDKVHGAIPEEGGRYFFSRGVFYFEPGYYHTYINLFLKLS